MDQNKPLHEANEPSSYQNTLAASPVYEGSEKTDLELNTPSDTTNKELDTDAERQPITEGGETVNYPGGVKLFLLA